MVIIGLFGEKGSGKSSFCKEELLQKRYNGKYNLISLDRRNEYGKLGLKKHLNISGWLPPNHIEDLFVYAKDSVFIIEEATGRFKGSISNKMEDILNGARHDNNRYIFCFHSLGSCPPQLIKYIDWVVLFNTNESEDSVNSKFPEYLDLWIDLKNAPRYTKKIIKRSKLAQDGRL